MYSLLVKKRVITYDMTIFQTPNFGDKKGYKDVYRLSVDGMTHKDALKNVFQVFNVNDRIPDDYRARYLSTGDIVLIDEGKKGQYYYKLFPQGWQKINRIQVR
ncbi:YodL domain-containing protein [Metabacillus litoralis]|uniref:YodL domain-containing protein n=1 Tax=Metabacillus litoralis TaxID=152268 RepID=UPI001CFEF759|nr:YodL domain-containing protein [Metabacillus litoralis]